MQLQFCTQGLAFVFAALAPAASHGAQVTCVDRLQIQGVGAGELRARLRYGRLGQADSPACDSAEIRLVRRGSAYSLSMRLGGQKVERQVRSINDAATWAESWLDPIVNEPPESKLPAESAVSSPKPATVTRAEVPLPQSTPHHSSVTLGIGPEFTLGNNGSTTLGPSLFGQYRIVPRFWFGLNTGYAWQLADRWERSWLRISAVAGPAWDLSPRLSFTPGVGIGVYSGHMRDPMSTTGSATHVAGGFFELLARTSYRLSGSWSISGGLGARWHAFNSEVKVSTDDDDLEEHPVSTPETTSLEFTTTLGVCHRFGGPP